MVALDFRNDRTLWAKGVLLILNIILVAIIARYHGTLSDEIYFFAATCLSLIFTILLLLTVFLMEAGIMTMKGAQSKHIDFVGHLLAGFLLLIGAIVFSVAVDKHVGFGWKTRRTFACLFGFLNSFVHFGVAYLVFVKK